MAGDLDDIKGALKHIAESQSQLVSAFDTLSHRVDELAHSKTAQPTRPDVRSDNSNVALQSAAALSSAAGLPVQSPSLLPADAGSASPGGATSPPGVKSGFTSRIILTTYPKQIGINPLPMDWGNPDPLQRGPVAVSRSTSTIRRRNAIGAHGGSYSIYYALALASKELKHDHKPDYTNTEPAVNIGPFPQWGDKKKIVAMDPWGHTVPWTFKDVMDKENGMTENSSYMARIVAKCILQLIYVPQSRSPRHT